MNEGAPGKILLIRLSSIGDIVLTTPLIRRLRAAFPSAQIDYVVKEGFADLLRHHPALDRIYTVPMSARRADLSALHQELKRNQYDTVLDLHKNFRSLYLSRGLGRRYKKRLRKYGIRRFLLVKTGINLYDTVVPVYQRYLDVAAGLGLADDDKGSELFLPQQIADSLPDDVADFLQQGEFIALAPGAGFATKRWPVERFAAVAREILAQGNRCCILGSPTEQKLAGQIREQAPGCADFTGRLSLLESAHVVGKARRLLTNDSGLMHIAEAMGTPVVALFGSTVRELGFFPFLPGSVVIENSSIACRPCSHIGRTACPKGHFLCMKSLDVSRVVQALLE